MYLIDTSVWIDYLRNKDTPAASYIAQLLDSQMSFGITEHIYMEILQGAGSDKTLEILDDYFSGQRFYGFSESIVSHAVAARIYYGCRRRGITIRSSLDCLIAQVAREHELTLVHQDRDFLAMAAVVPDLKQHHFL